mmetsp:Transcript_24162/g.56115  ORF Transcript_24162/g.56115 Transcript_24162/m.56115 type:complete len:231 (-) Transcript_24162:331-1023(-)
MIPSMPYRMKCLQSASGSKSMYLAGLPSAVVRSAAVDELIGRGAMRERLWSGWFESDTERRSSPWIGRQVVRFVACTTSSVAFRCCRCSAKPCTSEPSPSHQATHAHELLDAVPMRRALSLCARTRRGDLVLGDARRRLVCARDDARRHAQGQRPDQRDHRDAHRDDDAPHDRLHQLRHGAAHGASHQSPQARRRQRRERRTRARGSERRTAASAAAGVAESVARFAAAD